MKRQGGGGGEKRERSKDKDKKQVVIRVHIMSFSSFIIIITAVEFRVVIQRRIYVF